LCLEGLEILEKHLKLVIEFRFKERQSLPLLKLYLFLELQRQQVVSMHFTALFLQSLSTLVLLKKILSPQIL
jgi:hypothetical protein